MALLLLSLLAGLGAAPHVALPLSFEQPDGTRIEIFASGDEFHNWLHDSDNYTIVRDDNGWYVYARQDGGNVAPTDLIVGRDLPTERGLEPGINLGADLIRAKYDRYAQMRDYSNGRSPHSGTFNNVVIFIKFADDPDFSSPITVYDDMFNLVGSNSMKNYFIEASYNQLFIDSSFYPEPDGNTIVCYVDSHPRNYYRVYSAANPIGYNGDSERTQREQQMLVRAVNAVSSQIPASLDIDGDDDGYVDNVCFIIQGSPDGWAELLWPHRWVLYAATAYIHGAQVWDFNFQLENSMAGSGASVLAHEMFHSLSAPDLYRYSDNTITPIGSWDLMASNTNPPQHMSAWMKYKYGQWIASVPEITASGTYSLSSVAGSATGNIYRVPSWRTGEYYILEYRKPAGSYDHTVPHEGLLVYRLDISEDGNAQGPPDELYIYRPFGYNTTTNGALSMAAFSQQNGLTELSEATSPNGFMSNNSSGGLNLFDVGASGSETISFKIKVSDIQLTYPHGGETWFSGTTKTITWKAKSTTGTVTVEYSTNGGNQWTVLSTAAANNGNFIWSNIPILNSTTVHIRVTLNSNGHLDSNSYPFTILSEMAVPAGIYPTDGASGVPTNPQIAWTAVPGVTGYQFQLSTDPQFGSFVANLIDHPDNFYAASGLTPFTAYYWRVASISELGIGPFCDDLSFTTGDTSELPQAPELLSPAHMAVNLPQSVTFNWTSSYLAQTYCLQVANDPYFASITHEVEDLDATSHTISGLQPNHIYYWRVCAENVAGYSYFSLIRRFSTMANTEGEEDILPVPDNALAQNYPNPFNPSTTIALSLKDASTPARLEIFNTRGQRVRTLLDGVPSAHRLQLVWDGRDDQGSTLGSGIYYYRLRSGAFSETRKMLMIK
jgi:M6 family metalloprotease-like protein